MSDSEEHVTIQASKLSSGEVLIEDVICEGSEEPIARSGDIVDTKVMEDLQAKGITRVRIKAVVAEEPGSEAHDDARHQIELAVREALKEIAPRFRHCQLENEHVRALLHACSLRRAKQIIENKNSDA